jgi:UDP-N-acetyl-D-mannosaminuronic acid transferase (WecB/TagA/CpsF family)
VEAEELIYLGCAAARAWLAYLFVVTAPEWIQVRKLEDLYKLNEDPTHLANRLADEQP